jgi:hypothetical protein
VRLSKQPPEKVVSLMKSINSPSIGSNFSVVVKGNLGEEFAEFEKCKKI